MATFCANDEQFGVSHSSLLIHINENEKYLSTRDSMVSLMGISSTPWFHVMVSTLFHTKTHTDLAPISIRDNNISRWEVQLDWISNTSRRKINLPTNQNGYDTFETTVGKLSARRIHICCDYFCLCIILEVILNNFRNSV